MSGARDRGASDIGALIDALDRHGVRFVVAGSAGAMAHGVDSVDPADLDIVPAADRANLERLAAALDELAAEASVETGAWQIEEHGEHRWVEDGVERPPRKLDPAAPETFDHSFATSHGRLDVVTLVAGHHDDLRRRAARLPVAGRAAWVAHPVDLLAGMTAPRQPSASRPGTRCPPEAFCCFKCFGPLAPAGAGSLDWRCPGPQTR